MPRILSVWCSAQYECKQSAQAIVASIPQTSQRCEGQIHRSNWKNKSRSIYLIFRMYLRVGERFRNDCPFTLIHFGWNFLVHVDIWQAINWPVCPQPKHVSKSCSLIWWWFDCRVRFFWDWRPFPCPFVVEFDVDNESADDET